MANGNDDKAKVLARNTKVNQWVIVALTAIFVVLYALALFGLIKPLADDKVVLQLAPIIAVIIGYYFGRVPGQQNEKTLTDQVNQHAEAAKTANQEKETAEKEKTKLAGQIASVEKILKVVVPDESAGRLSTTLSGAAERGESTPAATTAILHALRILKQ